jgi:hypothetical protein
MSNFDGRQTVLMKACNSQHMTTTVKSVSRKWWSGTNTTTWSHIKTFHLPVQTRGSAFCRSKAIFIQHKMHSQCTADDSCNFHTGTQSKRRFKSGHRNANMLDFVCCVALSCAGEDLVTQADPSSQKPYSLYMRLNKTNLYIVGIKIKIAQKTTKKEIKHHYAQTRIMKN